MLPFALLVVLTLSLAYANGGNDVSKGVATLVGSGVTQIRAAVVWGAAWTVAGGLLAASASRGLAATFSGSGFLGKPASGPGLLASVAAGAVVWVAFATRAGLPVSTTHAIAGALVGAGVAAQGPSALHWSFLATRVALPLGLSPLVAGVLIFATLPLLRRGVRRAETYCVCVERRVAISGGALAMSAASPAVVSSAQGCPVSPAVTARVSALDGLHWLSSALTSFARGLNDTPKIAALGIAASGAFGASRLPFYGAVVLAMGAGSLIAGFRVTDTLARRVTAMTSAEGFGANLVTSLLVGAASFAGLPVSTTHVSSGAIVGIGVRRGGGSTHRRTVRDILLAWLVTVPVAALAGGGAYALARAVF